MSRAVSYFTFILVAPILTLIFVYAINKLWLQPVRIIILQNEALFYFALFMIVLLSTLVFSMIRFFARPLGIAFISTLFFTIYLAGIGIIGDAGSALLVFTTYFLLTTFAVGLADGFVKGYSLKGVRGR